MPIVGEKGQVILPKEQRKIAGIKAGDEVECFVSRKGVISIVAKKHGSAKEALSYLSNGATK